MDDWYEALDEGLRCWCMPPRQTNVRCDHIDRDFLLFKLEYYGTLDNELSWLRSDRYKIVFCGGAYIPKV